MEKKYLPEGQKFEMLDNRTPYFSKAALVRAWKTGEILEGIAAMCDNNYNLTVELGCMNGTMDKCEVTYDPSGNEKEIAIITRVGKVVCFRILGFEKDADGNEIARLSRRAAQMECKTAFLDGLQPGDVIPAKVTHMEPFGAFVDIGCGYVSLLPIDCISVSRISHPHDRFHAGMALYVVIKSIDRDTGRIYVSHKELLGTWEENAAGFSVGQTVRGVVRSIEQYGVFIELTPNLAGLAECREGLHIGQSVAVYIKNIVTKRMKIKLVVVDGDNAQPIGKGFHYCIPSWHMDSFLYSPMDAEKVIRTDFSEDGS